MGHAHDQKTARKRYVEHGVETLRSAGARITKPRLAVLECLAESERSLSPKDLMDRIKKRRGMPDIDLATVYRSLEALTELELVHRVGPAGEFFACAHHACVAAMHLVVHCLGCDKTTELDVPDKLMAPVRHYLETAAHFKPADHFLQVSGRCADCAI